jgi:anaerobic selenocysteine-containing dehydrogenase
MDFKNLTAPVSLARKTSHYIYEGMSFTADVREGIQWPTLAENNAENAPKLALRYIEPTANEADEATDEADGLTVIAPRFLYDGGRLLAEADVIRAHFQRPEVMVSRPDAERLNIKNNDPVTVSRNGTSVTLPVQINRSLSEGVIIVPRNLTGRPAEQLVGTGGLYTTVKVTVDTKADQ